MTCERDPVFPKLARLHEAFGAYAAALDHQLSEAVQLSTSKAHAAALSEALATTPTSRAGMRELVAAVASDAGWLFDDKGTLEASADDLKQFIASLQRHLEAAP